MTPIPWIKLIGVAAVALLVVLQYSVIKSQRAKLRECESSVVLYASANASNVKAIADLKAANEIWSRRGVDVQKSEAALRTVFAELESLRADAANRTVERETIYVRDPSARKWADTGVPADIADSLFPKADRPN